jgi:hypothetical protein
MPAGPSDGPESHWWSVGRSSPAATAAFHANSAYDQQACAPRSFDLIAAAWGRGEPWHPPSARCPIRCPFGRIGMGPRETTGRKPRDCRAFADAGGGTRTPDTRIMIPLL